MSPVEQRKLRIQWESTGSGIFSWAALHVEKCSPCWCGTAGATEIRKQRPLPETEMAWCKQFFHSDHGTCMMKFKKERDALSVSEDKLKEQIHSFHTLPSKSFHVNLASLWLAWSVVRFARPLGRSAARMEKGPTPYGHNSLLAYSLADGEFTYFTYLRFLEKSYFGRNLWNQLFGGDVIICFTQLLFETKKLSSHAGGSEPGCLSGFRSNKHKLGSPAFSSWEIYLKKKHVPNVGWFRNAEYRTFVLKTNCCLSFEWNTYPLVLPAKQHPAKSKECTQKSIEVEHLKCLCNKETFKMDKATKDKNLSNEYFVAVMTIALLIRFFAG